MRERSSTPAGNGPGTVAQPQLTVSDLVRDYHGDVYRYLYRLSGSATDAEDLTQQAFLIAHEKFHQLRDVEKVAGWLFRIARSCFLKLRRKRRPQPAGNLQLDVEGIAEQTRADDIDRERLAHALNELPDDFRLVLLMFYFEDLSYQEIAAELDIPLGTVMSRLSRAKGHLRRRLLLAEAQNAASGTPSAGSQRG